MMRHTQKSSKVDQILRTPDVVTRENLERNQMPCARDADRQIWQQLNQIGFRHHLAFDSR
jgi:hypothetical protein